MYEQSANGAEFVSLRAPASIASSFILQLPAALPTIAGQVLEFTTSGVASFVTPSAGASSEQFVVLQSAFYSTTTALVYIPLAAGTQTEATSITSSYVLHSCPFDGEVVRIAHSGYGGGSTAVTTHVNQSTTPLETVTVTLPGGGYVNVTEINFTSASAFSKGDLLHIGMDGTTMLGTCRVTVVLKYDTST